MASFVGIYARALADVVVDRRLDANRIVSELESMETVLKESADLRTLWDSPSVSGDQKLKLLDAITARIALSREVRNFVAVLISNRRIHAYNEIAKEAIHHIYERMGIADAEIVSARELSPDEKRNLEFGAAQATGKTLRVRYSVDQEIMGGAIVKVGSTVFDGSIRGQLERMKEQLAAG